MVPVSTENLARATAATEPASIGDPILGAPRPQHWQGQTTMLDFSPQVSMSAEAVVVCAWYVVFFVLKSSVHEAEDV